MASPDPLGPYRKVQSDAEKELTQILESTARSIRQRIGTLKVGIGGDVRRAQLNSTLAAIKRMQRSMWVGGVAPRVIQGVDDAEKAAESAIETMTRVAYASLPDAAAEILVRGLRAAAESGLKSDKARKRRELSSRVYRQASLNEGKVEQLIREGLIASLSAKELAATVYDHVSPTAKGGASYAAMRLARTEINNAFHERQLEGAKRPGVKAAKWNLSGSHRVPDLCNVYASHNGTGQWGADSIPDKPHPQCFCYLTYVTTPPEEFRKRLAAGSFDEEIERRTRENMARAGQKVGKLEPPKVGAAKKPAPRKAAPKAKAPAKVVSIKREDRVSFSVPSIADIKRSFESGLKGKPQTLSGGMVAATSKLDFNDGTSGVQKVIEDLPDEVREDIDPEMLPYLPSAKDQQDAEELGSMVARAFGLNAPEVLRTREDTTIQQFKEGRVGMSLSAGDRKKFINSDDGLVMSFMDQVIGNNDRNLGNWLTDGNRIIPIDFSGSWAATELLDNPLDRPMKKGTDEFQRTLRDEKSGDFKPNDLSQVDIDRMEEIMKGLEKEFAKRGQTKWWEWTMDRIDALSQFAQGTKRRIK